MGMVTVMVESWNGHGDDDGWHELMNERVVS